MDQNFQTSFIPKKPMIEQRAVPARPVGLLTITAFFIFFSVILASGGLYFYKKSLEANLVKMEKDLNLSKNRFEPSKITELQNLDKRLRASSEILSKHITISPIFEVLQKVTMKTVRYTNFSYELDSQNSKVKVIMKGQALGYRSVALQSDLLTQNKQLIDPVFSNLSLDEKGNVLFDLEFSVDPNFINYKKVLVNESSNSSDPAITNEPIAN